MTLKISVEIVGDLHKKNVRIRYFSTVQCIFSIDKPDYGSVTVNQLRSHMSRFDGRIIR